MTDSLLDVYSRGDHRSKGGNGTEWPRYLLTTRDILDVYTAK